MRTVERSADSRKRRTEFGDAAIGLRVKGLRGIVNLPANPSSSPLATVFFVALLVIWVAYPLAVALLAALARAWRSRRASGGAPVKRSVSVVVASCDDADAIRARVADILRCQRDGVAALDVVVALDAARAAATPAELSDLDPSVRVVPGDAPGGKSAALNAAVRASHGELLVFTDTHQRFAPDAIARLAMAFADSRVGAASGALHQGADAARTLAGRYWQLERRLREAESDVHSAIGVTGAIYAMRRELWSPLPAGLLLDDLFVPMRLVLGGHRVAFVPQARAVDDRRFDAVQEYRRKVRTLTGIFQLCAWLPAVLAPWRNPVWVQFVFHKLLRLATPFLTLGLLVAWSVALVQRGPLVGGAMLALAGACAAVMVLASARLREQLVWTVTLQSAVVVAVANGVRGRWEVWQR
jgi:cellulose synthase/poly-beta-1,6-N-acetylglucosamine synthase-like glycosyltransferase